MSMLEGGRKKIFVIGTGRSGTCWVGDVLGEHPEVRSYVEPRPVFDWVTQTAVNARDEPQLLPAIFAEYQKLYEDASPYHFADKSHPCIWISERLAEHFSDACFIGVTRDVVPTVASMLKHSGVRRWCEQWDRYEVPNRFLGITKRNLDWYRNATILERCVARWYAHHAELTRLQSALGTRMLLIKYETLVSDTRKTLSRMQTFLNLNSEFPEIVPHTASLTKWTKDFTVRDISTIESALKYLDHSASIS